MNIPNKITISRIIAVVLLVIFLSVMQVLGEMGVVAPLATIGNSGVGPIRIAVTAFFVIAAFTDHVDGHLARKWHQITDLGKFLDPIADKLLVDLTLIFLLFPWSFEAGTMTVPVFCVAIMIGRDFVVDGLRFVAAGKNIVLAANMWGKVKTVLQMVAIPFVLMNGWPFTYFDGDWNPYLRIANWLVYLATLASLWSGILYLYRNRHVFKESK